MADANPTRPFPPQSTSTDEIQRAVRGVENDALVRQIAARMAASPRDRKHTKTYIQPLPLPVLVNGELCVCAVKEHFIAHPREHQTETHWFSSVAAARKAFPQAQLLDDVERVNPGLRAQA
jgi:hypothetical protein